MKKTILFLKDVLLRFLNNDCGINAAGLTYFTLLAVVPVLCCILACAKLAGVDHFAKAQINERLDAMITNIEKGQENDLAQLAPQSQEEREKKRIAAHEFATQARTISNALFERVEKFDISTFGFIGFGFLLWTVISTLGQVEHSFNHIWDQPKGRPIWKCSYTYLFVMIILPLLAAVAMSMPLLNLAKNIIVATLGATWLTQWVSDGLILILDSWLFRFALSTLFASLLFGFMYWLMPNCRVKPLNSWLGGLLTAILFGGWLKVCAIAQIGIANASALYGTFAFLPIVLAWLYMSWQIILFGGCVVCELDLKRR